MYLAISPSLDGAALFSSPNSYDQSRSAAPASPPRSSASSSISDVDSLCQMDVRIAKFSAAVAIVTVVTLLALLEGPPTPALPLVSGNAAHEHGAEHRVWQPAKLPEATLDLVKVPPPKKLKLTLSFDKLPVFIMHGLRQRAADLSWLQEWIEEAAPAIRIIPVTIFEDLRSFEGLHSQLHALMAFIRDSVAREPEAFMDGYRLVCHSQGALLCRCLCEEMDDHNIKVFVSLAGPQNGVYGDPEYWTKYLPSPLGGGNFEAGDPSELLYGAFLQRTFSLANMWHDPYGEENFIHYNTFLPVYNGLTEDTAGNERRKGNFIRLEKAVFMGGFFENDTFDGAVKPSSSMLFGFWKSGGRDDYQPMREQKLYVEDTFGLRTLQESGRVQLIIAPQVAHNDFVFKKDVALEYVIPNLN